MEVPKKDLIIALLTSLFVCLIPFGVGLVFGAYFLSIISASALFILWFIFGIIYFVGNL